MSIVTSVVLVVDSNESRTLLRQINAWLADCECYGEIGCYELRPVDTSMFGGNKLPGVEVWGGGFNMFSRYQAEFVDLVLRLPWRQKSTTILTIQTESSHTQIFRPEGWQNEEL